MDFAALTLGLAVGSALGFVLGNILAARRRASEAESFQAIAGRALQQNNEQFLQLAAQRLENAQQRGASQLQEHRQSFELRLEPLDKRLAELRAATEALERKRKEDEGQLKGQLDGLQQATASLQQQTTSLKTALEGSRQSGGRWGEVALRNVVEYAGMSAHCDFEEQKGTADGQRPDLTVRLPGDGRVAVDAKVPIRDYLNACEATEEAPRREALERHARALRAHVKELSQRAYWQSLGDGVDLVVLFLPSDAMLAAAFAADPELQPEALRKRVLIASPSTLVALLRTIALYWQQNSVATGAREIAEVARELYDRVSVFVEHLTKTGKGLSAAVTSYNAALRSFETRVVPQGRRLEELKVPDAGARLEAPPLVDGEALEG